MEAVISLSVSNVPKKTYIEAIFNLWVTTPLVGACMSAILHTRYLYYDS
jgi:phosphate/sulfate permease